MQMQISKPAGNISNSSFGENCLCQLLQKIHTEYLTIEHDICCMDASEIFYSAGKIAAIMNIYEYLLSIAPKLTKKDGFQLLARVNLIQECYGYWKQNDDQPIEDAVLSVLKVDSGKEIACA